MALPYFGSYTFSASGYAAAGGAIRTDVKNVLAVLSALLPQDGTVSTPVSPDFNLFTGHQANMIRGEIARIGALIDAAS